jgi:hypothetical protein
VALTVKGLPESKEYIPLTAQPPTIGEMNPLFRNGFCLPNGSS